MFFIVSATIICCIGMIVGIVVAGSARHHGVLVLDHLSEGTRGLTTTDYTDGEIKIIG